MAHLWHVVLIAYSYLFHTFHLMYRLFSRKLSRQQSGITVNAVKSGTYFGQISKRFWVFLGYDPF